MAVVQFIVRIKDDPSMAFNCSIDEASGAITVGGNIFQNITPNAWNGDGSCSFNILRQPLYNGVQLQVARRNSAGVPCTASQKMVVTTPYFSITVSCSEGENLGSGYVYVDSGVFYTGAVAPLGWAPGGSMAVDYQWEEVCPIKYANPLVLAFTDLSGYTDVCEITAPEEKDAYNGNLPPAGTVPIPATVMVGGYTYVQMRGKDGGFLKPGSYTFQSLIGGEWITHGTAQVNEGDTSKKVTLYPVILKQYPIRTLPPEIRIVTVLPTVSCPPSKPVVVVPAEEITPVPLPLPSPEPITPLPLPPPGPVPPTGLDACCQALVDQLSGIKGELRGIGEQMKNGLESISNQLKGINDILRWFKQEAESGRPWPVPDEETKNILKDIAHSLIVGYDDPEGIKERVADICAAFLNLIDSRRG